MKHFDQLKRRVPLYAMVSPDSKDFVSQLNEHTGVSEGKILDLAIGLLKETKIDQLKSTKLK
jgi:hypothetical protein